MNPTPECCVVPNAGASAGFSPRGRRRSFFLRALPALWAVAAVVVFAAPAERAMAQSDPDTTPVNIPDANLRAALETQLGKAAGATITRAEMAAHTGFLFGSPPRRTMRLDHRNWNSNLIHAPVSFIPTPTAPATVFRILTGLEYLTAIQGLSMIRHRITDLRPLAGLTEMRRLWLNENLISDLSPLRGLPLDHLSLRLNPVSDLSPLAGMVWLANFNCDKCQISDISPLAGLTRLTYLDLQNNYISDISPLTRVNDLAEVFLSDNRISDLSPVANRNLRTLTAAGNRITDLSPLRNSLNMETLDLNGNQGLRDVSVVERMVALKVLRLDGTDVRDLSPLVANTGLGSGDHVYLRNLPNLNADAEQHVATLRGRGVSVRTSSPLRVDKTVRGVAVTPGVERLTVTWNPPTVGYTPGFQRVYWWFGFQDRSSSFTPPQHHDVPGDASSYTIPNLTPGVVYKVQIYPLSPTGDLSAIASGIPLAPAAPQVTSVTVAPSVESLIVSWNPIDGASGYKVQWKSGEQEYDPATREASVSGADTTSHTIPGLTPGVEYTVRVIATSPNAPDGRPSDEATGTPLAPAPAQVTSVTVAPSVESLIVSWNPVDGANGYKVQWKSGEQEYDPATREASVSGADTTSHTIPGLTPGVEYTVRVIATSSNAPDGEPSDEATGTPMAAPQVTSVTVTPGVESLIVSWNPVDGASGYKVQWKSGEQEYDPATREASVSGADTTSHTIPGLTPGVEYTVRVIATSPNAPDGEPSDEATGTPMAPAAPQVTSVTVAPSVESLIVSWNPVADANGYKVQWKSGEQEYDPATREAPVSGADTTSHTIPGLTPGVEYRVRVIATGTNAPDGGPSDEATGTPLAPAPAQVTSVTVAPSVESLIVSWNPVADANGYKVQWKSGEQEYDPATREAPVSGADTTSHTIPGLTPGTEYTVRVIATGTNAPDGRPSDEATGTPLAPAPAQVTSVTVAPSMESLIVSWNPVDGANGYKVQWKSGEQEYDPATREASVSGADTTSHTIPGLTPGVEYTVRVIATGTNAPDGEPSDEVTGVPARRVHASIADAAAVEGAVVEFPVQLTEPSTAVVTLTWSTGDETAKAPEDYQAMAGGRLTLQPGDDKAILRVPTREDQRIESAETFHVRLTGAANAAVDPQAAVATGTITDDDRAPVRGRAMGMALAGMGRWVTADAVDVIEERFTGSQAMEAQVGLGGRTLPLAGVGSQGPARSAAPGTRSARYGLDPGRGGDPWTPGNSHPAFSTDSIARSRFNLPLGRQVDGAAPGGTSGWRVWGQGSVGGFDGKPEPGSTIDGEVVGGYLGLDYRPRQDALVGVALAHSRGEVDYAIDSVTSGEVDLDLTSVLPYAHWSPRAGMGAWGLLGAGWGRAELKDEAGKVETDLRMWMAAAGLRQDVASWREIDLALKADGFLTELKTEAKAGLPEAKGEARRLRLRLEGRREWEVSPVSRMTPRLELGGRWDGGTGEDGLGMEVGGGLAYTHTDLGLEVEARGRFLLAHQANGFGEWGGSLTVTVDPGQAGQGPWMRLSPGWGREGSRVAQMWDGREAFRGADGAPELSPNRLSLDVGWGLPTHGGAGLLTPYAGLSMSGSEMRDYRMGARMKTGSRMSMGLEGRRRKAAQNTQAGYEVLLTALWNW